MKYTERGYRIGKAEAHRVRDRESTYWVTTRESGVFVGGGSDRLAQDDLRQIWRNHLLGLSMVRRGTIARFVSVTLYPAGNEHFTAALGTYHHLVGKEARGGVRGCTFEQFIACLCGPAEIEAWKQYLTARYLVGGGRMTRALS